MSNILHQKLGLFNHALQIPLGLVDNFDIGIPAGSTEFTLESSIKLAESQAPLVSSVQQPAKQAAGPEAQYLFF